MTESAWFAVGGKLAPVTSDVVGAGLGLAQHRLFVVAAIAATFNEPFGQLQSSQICGCVRPGRTVQVHLDGGQLSGFVIAHGHAGFSFVGISSLNDQDGCACLKWGHFENSSNEN